MAAIGDGVVQRACGIAQPSAKPEHVPYYPLAVALPGFVKNDQSVSELLLKFGAACALVLGSTWVALNRWNGNLKPVDRDVVLWFVLCGCLHTLFEGYYVIHHASMASQMDVTGQLWKEYALSDSRYLTQDTFVLSIETITALVWGPLSFCTAAAVASSHPLRHSLQTIVSMAHIYGCALYFATATLDLVLKGTSHSRPEFVYFWVYYFGMNFVFIAIPSATPPETPSPLRPRSHYHATSVQDRIREWQAHGAANALDPDAVSVRSTPLSTSNAPRRRLVSDQHWRASKDTSEPRPATRTPKDPIVAPHHDLSYTSNQRREERIMRREQRRQSRLERQSQLLEGGRIDAKKQASPPTTVDDLNSYIDRELAHHRSKTPPMEETPSVEERPPVEERPLVEEDAGGLGSLHRPKTRSMYADSLGPPESANGGLTKSKSKSKSKGAAVFFKTKDLFGRYEKPVGQRGPSIEAWLNEQPDPFVEDEATQGVPPAEAPEGRQKKDEATQDVAPVEAPEGRQKKERRGSKRRTSSRETPETDSIWDSVSPTAHDQTPPVQPRDTSWTYGDESLTQGLSPRVYRPEASPSTLRRHGRTRKSRRRTSASHSNSQPEPLSLSSQPQQQPDRLCPPTGVHQLSTIASVETLDASHTPLSPPPPPPADMASQSEEPRLKRKLTTHEDLMSVLSLPMQRRSTRSRRRAQQPLQPQSAEDLLASLAAEEDKYGRELRTLVDGIIPVLLQCVLSKSDSPTTTGLFMSTADGKDNMTFTKPIVDMGVALERLKSLHSRMPTHSIDALVVWAHTAQKSYNAYLTAWRLGFQDVVVNLEPLDNGKEVDQGMSRDADGDVVDTAGKKADVAYLLKRPLVRVKNLSKTFESIKEMSDRALATEVAAAFADLTALARRRHQEEQGRLEDEAAARIDSTRARDIRTLAATAKASINPNRRVRARDSFGLSMYHSTGQRLDCRIEMIMRDNPPGSPTGGDVLICEIDDSGKWLLFPPVELASISARRAEDKSDLVVMVRGPAGLGKEWHELLALTADDPETRFMGLNLGGGLQSKSQHTWKKQERPQEKPVPRRRRPSGLSFDRSTISDQSIKEVPNTLKASSTPTSPEPGTAPLSPKEHRKPYKNEGLYMMSGALSDRDQPPRQSLDRKPAGHSSPEWKKPQLARQRHSSNPTKKSHSAPTTPIVQKPESAPKAPAAPSANRPPAATKSRHSPHQQQDERSTPLNASIQQQSSSPLKHEYAPSTASDSSSDSDSDGHDDSSSDTSEGFVSETKDVAMPLVAVTAAGNKRSTKFGLQPPPAAPTSGTRTLAPSDSASQGPYRKVPPSTSVPEGQKTKTIAVVCSWSDKGVWEQIHPDECSIVISPGLIEAFEMSPDHSGDVLNAGANASPIGGTKPGKSSSAKREPLVAFELTPVVPLRRGTALDISIRSPPTATSRLKTTNNIMFRSRNADECDTLYSMINWARCNNPTYIQLQRARPQEASVTFNTGSAGHKRSGSRAWLGLGRIDRRSSYRASAHPAARLPSVGGDSEASAGTLSSAFSALKRFGVSSAFNLNRSSVTWQTGRSRASASLYSSESGTLPGSGSGTSTPQPSQLGFIPGRDGPNVPGTSAEAANGAGMVNNMKIRLYVRKGQHWEDLGAGRLTVMPGEDRALRSRTSGHPAAAAGGATPSRAPSAGDATPPGVPRLPSASHTPNRLHGNGKEKRVIVRKAKDDKVVLLEATLGESCFERVMQTGIAVKVWDEDDTIADKGGVVLGHGRVYMMQFPGTREAGWVFGLCGTYRYGTE
ncbi:hypothetical protein DV737_g4849, partial [Chaetothyriales sp. CBS 132003]